MSPLVRRSVLAAAALASVACQNDFTPPSAIQGLRVLAVREDPGSGSPGTTVHLEMLLADGLPPDSPPVQVAWIGGCHNPPSRQYYACLPALRRLAGSLPTLGADTAALAEIRVGSGAEATKFDEKLPDDVLSAAPKLATDPVHYGVSYVFFAACAGTLALSGASEFPITCTDAAGAPVGPAGFVIGFTTIYSYEDLVNQNPVLASLDFDGAPVLTATPDSSDGLKACTVDDDCADLTFAHPAGCSANGVCAPIVEACGGSSCPGHRVSPHLADASVESWTGGSEVVWASYYANHGAFDGPTELVVDAASGLLSDYSQIWKAPPPNSDAPRRTARLWVTLNDQRGGATWGFFDVLVE